MTDLTAASLRHAHCTGRSCVQLERPGQSQPCDAALFRDALDEMTARVQDPCLERERDAERALADELARHLRRAIDDLIGDWELLGGPQMDYPGAEAALAKHRAARP